MGFLQRITHYFMGEKGADSDIIHIKDGVIMNAEKSTDQANDSVENSITDEWRLPDDYIEDMVKAGVKERTAKEYGFDIASFGINPVELEIQHIKNRLCGLTTASQRRKLTALRSYARWLMSRNEHQLWLKISAVQTKEIVQ